MERLHSVNSIKRKNNILLYVLSMSTHYSPSVNNFKGTYSSISKKAQPENVRMYEKVYKPL